MSNRHHDSHHHLHKKKFGFGTSEDDVIDGTNGNDFLFGFGGDDEIFAFRGNDTVFGGRGNDRIHGGEGNDSLFGEKGNDGLAGGAGNDDLHGGHGRDFLVGGAGRDDLTGGQGPDKFVLRQGTGVDTIEDLGSNDRIDLRDFNFASAQDVLDAFRQRGHDAVLDLGGGDKLIIEDTRVSRLDAAQFIVSDAETGVSSSQSPYVVGVHPSISTLSLLTVGDQVGFKSDGVTPWKMVGIPDGLGAYDNGDGTFTVLMNQELAPTQGAVCDHGATGAFVSKLVFDKTTLEALSGEDLIKEVYLYNTATDSYDLFTAYQFNRLCSADLPEHTAFYNPVTGLGYSGRIFMSGEENGPPFGDHGRTFAHFVDGASAGESYELAWLGNNAYENTLANPYTGNETVVAITDDTGNVNNGVISATGNGEVFFYFGTKKGTGTDLDKTGLTGGNLYALQVAELPVEVSTNASPLGADQSSNFNLVSLGDVSELNGAQIQTLSDTAGATKFLRPEDGAWDTVSNDRFYFVTTGNIASPDAPSRLWAVDFNGVPSEAALGGAVDGTIRLLLDGTEGQEMFDNITVTKDGKVLLQEDVGNNAHIGKIWEYDPASDAPTLLAQHDPDRFTPPTPSPFNQDEESSGIIDVTDILGSAGQNAFLFDVQAHFNIVGELVQGGQLGVIYQDLI